MLTRAETEGRITGVPISFRGTQLSHLFFADDSLLFCRATFSEWGYIHRILQSYERASGQKLNSNKTSIFFFFFFSKNTKREFQDHIASLVGHSAMTSYHNYLGLLTLVGRSKYKTFYGIRNRVSKCFDGWKERFLSQAGKEVLLKAVVQAISTYSMSVFWLPKSLCSQLNSLMSKFWWSSQKNERKMAWLSWEILNRHAGWALGNWKSSTSLCLQNKVGGFYKTQSPW